MHGIALLVQKSEWEIQRHATGTGENRVNIALQTVQSAHTMCASSTLARLASAQLFSACTQHSYGLTFLCLLKVPSNNSGTTSDNRLYLHLFANGQSAFVLCMLVRGVPGPVIQQAT